MASLTLNNIFVLTLDEHNILRAAGGAAGPFFITKLDNPDATSYQVDNLLNVDKNHLEQFTVEYLGRTENGIIGQLNGTYYYFTNDWLSTGDVVTLEFEPYILPVCFVKGTLITTLRGEVAIEDLIPGDSVMGSSGWRQVKWIGWRHYGALAFIDRESAARIAPVRIRAHAIAERVPDRDLLLSPWHHLMVEGKLVRAGDLLNGLTISQESSISAVSYYHVELDQFDIIMAHGVYSESWADGGNRDFFQNVDVTALRPEDRQRRRAPRPGFDHLVVHKGKELANIQRRVAERAAATLNTARPAKKKAA
ncbi:Hint domain-containing protein [Bordetella sp. 15P40C-2]|uniref:Hint domain-containing protein n=1 Tax=Bordetella sp. 15P40C-2 TaxID=2572246 RepID=UPI0013231D27|nr:Hint domain-containing protein [Bordetella sp. 15P40C-2]MVW72203.1 hypothetical protein [Bordetella sp. 15P40C-2]